MDDFRFDDDYPVFMTEKILLSVKILIWKTRTIFLQKLLLIMILK